MFDKTVTVFNRHDNTWYPHVISGVSVYASDAYSPSRESGPAPRDEVDINIQCSSAKSIVTSSGPRSYIGPKEYERAETPTSFITFKAGRDFIFLGDYADLSAVDDNDYDEGFYTAMNNAFDDVYLIQSVSYFSLIPHFEIRGK